MLAYALDKALDCGRICNDVQKLINSHNESDPQSDKLLIISIRNIVNEQTDIPKLTHDPNLGEI
jgi:hypothetical protein